MSDDYLRVSGEACCEPLAAYGLTALTLGHYNASEICTPVISGPLPVLDPLLILFMFILG